mgnify:CR=1 FL=1|jgi:hypothetical protein
MDNGLGKKVLEFLIFVFILLFLTAFSYWCYQLHYIHSSEFNTNIDNDVDIMKAAAHEVIAFQACILAFLILALLVFVMK